MKSIQTHNMTVEEKLLGMEVLWNDLCKKSQIDSPEWHKKVLMDRDNNQETPMSWQEAKRDIYNRI